MTTTSFTSNTNCLENIECPDCGNHSRFTITAIVAADVSDDGAEFHGDAEWDDNSPITCPNCDRTGKLRDFKTKPRARINVIDWAHHRNGMCGAPFHVILFDDVADEDTRKVGILFEEPYYCAVLDVAKLAAGNIAFGVNSYRGDRFETSLRHAVKFPK
jgi:hypothetical protein